MPMTREDFVERAEKALGGYGWISAFSRITGKNIATVRRWIDGVSPVPDYAETIIELLEVVPLELRPRRFFAKSLLGRGQPLALPRLGAPPPA